ncbi:MAG TPA: TonB-dependent receptor [Phenylobacterium sp.]|jgi:outer membrane receptor protein involved in Fe transport|uniref:TonB-dependent receptor plug domain-containing protein n=1 Tax=Phenylobacterium sp. TaxID=1871053 RepID=UPI002D4E91F2|nr:TonB-dependent receptor [Phenylobacterium sp.]HZZ69493.1 TonB-dependent receptor [Phenylobacterium sp.]
MLFWVLAQAAVAAVAPAAGPVGAPSPNPAAAPVQVPAEASPATSGAAVGGAQPAVVSYPPEFFKDVHPNTALDMINRLPGFALDTGSSVRGYEGAAGNVLIDGQRPAVKTEGIDSILQRMLATHVARIDVIRGAAPGIDMQGKTVIANVITKKQNGARGIFHYADQHVSDGRRLGTLRVEGSGQVGQRTWEGGLTLSGFTDDGQGDGPRTDLNADGSTRLSGHIHSQGWGTQNTLTGATEAPLGDGRLRINARVQDQVYDYNELDTITVPDDHTEHDHQDDNYLQTELGGRYNQALGGRTNIEIVALRQDKHERFADAFNTPSDAQLFHQDTTTAESILSAVVKFQQTPRLSWEAGAEGAYNTLENRIAFSDNGVIQQLPASHVDVEEKRGEVFGKAVWRPFSTITLEGALREEGSQIGSTGDVNLQKSLYYTKPRVVLTWAPSADTQVRLRYEREVGQLDFGSFTASTSLVAGVVTAGNPNLVPQQDWASEVAFEQHFLGSGGLVLTARHLEITDVVDRAPIFQANGPAFDAPANIGNGAEDDAVVNLTVPLDRFGLKGAQVRADYTRRWSQVIDPTTHTPRPITALHPNDWDAHFSQPFGRVIVGVDIGGGWQQRLYRFNEIEIDKLGTYVTPYWEWKPRPDLSWRIEIDNVTARGFKHTYENYDGARNIVPLDFTEERSVHPGRVFYLRLRKTFGS